MIRYYCDISDIDRGQIEATFDLAREVGYNVNEFRKMFEERFGKKPNIRAVNNIRWWNSGNRPGGKQSIFIGSE